MLSLLDSYGKFSEQFPDSPAHVTAISVYLQLLEEQKRSGRHLYPEALGGVA